MRKYGFIPDPDFEGWDGVFLDPNAPPPADDYDYSAAGRYMRETGKEFKDMTQEEIDQFRFDPDD